MVTSHQNLVVGGSPIQRKGATRPDVPALPIPTPELTNLEGYLLAPTLPEVSGQTISKKEGLTLEEKKDPEAGF